MAIGSVIATVLMIWHAFKGQPFHEDIVESLLFGIACDQAIGERS